MSLNSQYTNIIVEQNIIIEQLKKDNKVLQNRVHNLTGTKKIWKESCKEWKDKYQEVADTLSNLVTPSQMSTFEKLKVYVGK